MQPGKELEGDGGCGEQGPGFPKQLWELLPGGKTPCQAPRVDHGSAFVLSFLLPAARSGRASHLRRGVMAVVERPSSSSLPRVLRLRRELLLACHLGYHLVIYISH